MAVYLPLFRWYLMGHSVSGCWAEGADGTRKEEEWGGGEAS